MNTARYINLSEFGYDKRYIIYENGAIFDTELNQYVEVSREHKLKLKDKDGKNGYVTLKKLYRKIFDKHNNKASNLRWLSRSENAKAFYNGLGESKVFILDKAD